MEVTFDDIEYGSGLFITEFDDNRYLIRDNWSLFALLPGEDFGKGRLRSITTGPLPFQAIMVLSKGLYDRVARSAILGEIAEWLTSQDVTWSISTDAPFPYDFEISVDSQTVLLALILRYSDQFRIENRAARDKVFVS